MLDKSYLYLTSEEIIKPLEKKTVIGYGLQGNNSLGNLIITFNVLFPSDLNVKRKEYIKKLLAKANDIENPQEGDVEPILGNYHVQEKLYESPTEDDRYEFNEREHGIECSQQ